MKSYCRACRVGYHDYCQYCPSCGSAHIISHQQLSKLYLAHIDCDSFYAAVEKRDNPALQAKPVIVGGEHRGVVAAACYVARIYGVRSAMPIHRAKELCPDIVIIKPNMQKYRDEGLALRQLFMQLTPTIEPLSLDEAYLDFNDAYDKKRDPALQLLELQHYIYDTHHVTISIGLSSNKLLAKIASDMNKPYGFTAISRDEAPALLANKSTRILWGIGPKTADKLESYGIKKVKDIQQIPLKKLRDICGNIAVELKDYAFGYDTRGVSTIAAAKTISSETTLYEDTISPNVINNVIEQAAININASLVKKNYYCQGITLKVKDSNFRLMTRSKKLSSATQHTDDIAKVAQELWLQHFSHISIRLLGVTAYNIIHEQGNI